LSSSDPRPGTGAGSRHAPIPFLDLIAPHVELEAELLSVDGYYRTAEEVDATLRGRPAQAWLNGDTLMVATLE